MVGVDDLPLKVEGLHGTVDFAHDVVRLGLAPDAKMPLAALDRSPSVSLLHRSHRLVPQWGDPLRVGFVSGALLRRHISLIVSSKGAIWVDDSVDVRFIVLYGELR